MSDPIDRQPEWYILKPCPFCGGRAIFDGTMYDMKGDNTQQTVFTISCSKCNVSLPTYGSIRYRFYKNGNLSIYHDDRDEVVRKWNERISESYE